MFVSDKGNDGGGKEKPIMYERIRLKRSRRINEKGWNLRRD